MAIIFAAGGTGGHLIPAITIARKMKTKPSFLVSSKSIDKEIVSSLGFSFRQLPLKGNRNLIDWFKTAKLVLVNFKETRPKVVVGFGGFISVVPLLAGVISNSRRLIFEAEVEPSKSTRFLSFFVEKIISAHPLKLRRNDLFCGYPVRDEFFNISPTYASEFTVLVLGGSQAADFFDKRISVILSRSPIVKRIIHQARQVNLDYVQSIYQSCNKECIVKSFFDEPWAMYQAAHLVIIRAGAGSVFETFAAGRPFITIPYPFAANQHQLRNSEWLINEFPCGLAIKQDDPEIEKKIFDFIERVASGKFSKPVINHDLREFLKSSSIRIAQYIESLAQD